MKRKKFNIKGKIMKHIKTNFEKGFSVQHKIKNSQFAVMVLEPGTSTGGPNNKHKNSDQWLFVISGIGKAVINNSKIEFDENSLLLIEKGETHEIVNTGNKPLKTINIYVPPAY